MVAIKKQHEHEEPEICLLKEWLPKISGEKRAFIKGASKALLYAQEIQSLPLAASLPLEIDKIADYNPVGVNNIGL